ncbi:MAG: virginiamycin B lyase family protein [Rhabdochlamydiaceae bacterium]
MRVKKKISLPRSILSFATLAIVALSVSGMRPLAYGEQISHIQAGISGAIAQLPTTSAALTSVDHASHAIREIQLIQNDSEPLGIATDSLGNVWFAENNQSAIVEYFPSNQTFITFHIPTNGPSMIWFMLFDDNGNLWFSNALQPFLWSFSPHSQRFANFSTGEQYIDPYGLAFDNKTQRIWFTSIYTDQIGYFQISGNTASLARLINVTGSARTLASEPRFGPSGIAIDSRGNIFASETFSGGIIEYSQDMQKFVDSWSLPAGSEPVGIALDNNRDRIWFSNHATSLIGYVDGQTGKVTEYATSLFSYLGENITLPYWVQLSENGSVWFDEHVSNKIARLDPATGQLTEFLVPTSQSAPLRFVIDNQRNVIWFTEFFGSKLGQLDANESCGCQVQLSEHNLNLSGASTKFFVKFTNSANQGLISSDQPAPLISGSLSKDGYLGANLTILSTALNSSYYQISLERGMTLGQGNYSITICPRESDADNSTSSPAIRQCAVALLTVTGGFHGAQEASTVILALGIIVVCLAVSLVYVRKWRSDRSKLNQA